MSADLRRAVLAKRMANGGRMAAGDIARVLAQGDALAYELLHHYFDSLSMDVQKREHHQRVAAFHAEHAALTDGQLWARVEACGFEVETPPTLPLAPQDRQETMEVLMGHAGIPAAPRLFATAPCISWADLIHHVAHTAPPVNLGDVFPEADVPTLMMVRLRELAGPRLGKKGRAPKGEPSILDFAKQVVQEFMAYPGCLDADALVKRERREREGKD